MVDASLEISGVVATAIDASADCGREDLRDRLQLAVDRMLRPATVVCVVGEFKQGKSSLVNALLGRTVCPVDDDLATSAVTFVHHHAEPRVVVRRRGEDGGLTAEVIAPDGLAEVVTERGNPDNERRIDRVEVGFPHPLLAGGLTLVDTPGMGGLGAGHAAATLAYLPFADGLVFVSDASSELTRPEVDFLRQAREACPTVVFCLTKTDLYPEWRRIADLDAGHLQREGLGDLAVVAVSSTVRGTALKRKDAALNDESGFVSLLGRLEGEVVTPAKAIAAKRAAGEAASAVDQLLRSDEDELGQLRDPARGRETVAALEAAQERFDHLRGPGARWQQVLSDGITDLTADVGHQFRNAMRTISRNGDAALEEAANAAAWEALVRTSQAEVATAVADAFAAVDAGAVRIAGTIVDILQSEQIELPVGAGTGRALDVRDVWQVALPKKGEGRSGVVSQGMTVLQGMSSGAMILGAMSRVLPAAAAGLLALNPVVVGVGLVMGGQRAMDQRRRKVATQRQAARTALRQFYDDVQFEIGNELTNALRGAQRQLRDEFTARVTELHRTCADTLTRMQSVAKQEAAEQRAREELLDRRAAALAELAARAASVAG